MEIRIYQLIICMGITLLFNLRESLAASHGHSHTDPWEQDCVQFMYDPDSHYFIAATKSTCWAIPLVRDEYDRVHGTIGMDGLEMTMMRQWIGKLPETRVYHDDPNFPAKVMSHCRGKDIFQLERNGTSPTPQTSATSSILVG